MHIPCIYKCMTYQVGLLNVSETLRVGCTPEGFLGIYSHPWFAEIDWQAVTRYHRLTCVLSYLVTWVTVS